MNSPQESHAVEMEVLPAHAIEQVSRAEIDVQISTAHRFPRTISKVKADMMSFATLDQDTAAGCFYSLPRGGKNIQGPSVRLAEIAVSCYGNIRAGSRILETVTTGETPHVVVQAVAHDLEKNVSVSIEKRRRIIGKKDYRTNERKPIDEDDINLATNACSAIAFRDAVFKTVPLALVKPVMEAAKKVAIGDAKTLVDRRAKAMEAFLKMGVQKDRILAVLQVRSLDDITLEHLETLLGLHTAIRDGTISVDEAFPPVPATISKAEFAQPQGSPPAGSTFLPAPEPPPADGLVAPSATPVEAAPQSPPPKRRGRPPGSKQTPTAPETEQEPQATTAGGDHTATPYPATEAAPSASLSPVQELEQLMAKHGYTWDEFYKFAVSENWLTPGMTGWNKVLPQIARTIVKFSDSIISDMKAMTGH